ncbi:hypothetical protein [Gorillibacterium massiliense]|uniref:hypothetical protein n=1 Tax=Gorillibacterium massiliense TaxID=1280390 RepID=UPI0005937246|nr:hypothetical protein [Gorillibacterium massiliense]
MKKLIILLSSIIIISNAIWSYVFYIVINKPSDTTIQVYNLNGTGVMWDVINYQIIVSPSKILRGHGGLIFKGDPNQIENSTYYKYELKEINSNGSYETVYVKIASSEDGPVSILNNLNIGSITGEHAYDEQKKDKQNYENTTITITWNDGKGEFHSETVDLEINSEITLNDD